MPYFDHIPPTAKPTLDGTSYKPEVSKNGTTIRGTCTAMPEEDTTIELGLHPSALSTTSSPWATNI